MVDFLRHAVRQLPGGEPLTNVLFCEDACSCK